ncbi:MAG: hypothetical protein FJ265_08145 [Planctomycetes bacterium]|nr:hypothetical protein [Planctomycetota bacterium]
MSHSPGEVHDDEWLLRRIQADRGPVEDQPQPSHLTFRPHERDVDDISLWRESMVSPEELAGSGRTGKRYFVGRIRADVVRALGMSLLVSEDRSGKPGHVLIPELRADNRKERTQEAWQFALAGACSVVGPFDGRA